MNFSLSFVEEYIDQAQRCTTARELRDGLLDHISRLGFEHVSVLSLSQTPDVVEGLDRDGENPFRIGTYPEAWFRRFFAESYQEVDPVCLMVKTAQAPFYWKDCYARHEYGKGWTERGYRFRAEAEEHGLIGGITIPIENKSSSSCISFCGSEAGDTQGVMHMMHLIGIYFQQRLLALEKIFGRASGMRQVKLTPREIEVLQWYAHGKSAWDIGVILGVSERTVRFHMSGIRKKYGVSSSVHATALAISCNQIEI